MAQLAEQLICNQQVIGSSPIIGLGESQFHMDGFPSGQRGQTVNLLRHASVVRIHLHPFKISIDILILIVYNRNVNIDAGWSSLEARRAHNPKVIGSNPVPAIYAQIAQLVEQRTENPRVAGSIPALGIYFLPFYGVLAQSVEHLTFNQVVRGSNPRCFINSGNLL